MSATQSSNLESHSNGGEAPRAERLNYRRLWLLGGAAIGGLIVSGGLFWTLWVQGKKVAETQFHLDAEKKVEAVRQMLSEQLSTMSLLKAFYAGSMEVDRREFKIFTDSIFAEHPDIKLMAWMPHVRLEDRSAYEEAMKKAGIEQYEIIEHRGESFVAAVRREKYFPIEYIEPRDKHRALVGFDIGSLPGYRGAMELAEANLGPAIVYQDLPGVESLPEPRIYMIETARNEPPSSTENINPAQPSDGLILGMFHLSDVVKKRIGITTARRRGLISIST